ncbi:MAG: helix-turn-helix domain-containing protein [Streptosporangiales bacterium]|nr:helix-turn-helix domain-containing protein [Streptosporangiales bacterium]
MNIRKLSGKFGAHQFQDRFGAGVVTALDLVRLSRAESLQARTNLPIASIGRACSYQDALHFSRRFRAVYGVFPRAYRTEPAVTSPVTTRGLARLVTRLLDDESP